MIKKIIRKIKSILIRLIISLICLSVFGVLIYRWVNPPVTTLMVIRTITAILDGKKDKTISYTWVDYEKISPFLILAVIASEDQNFPNHWGFDLEAIEKAIKHNKKARRKRGASTITQQVAKNLFLWNKRNWLRKGLEVYFTSLIEILWSKKRIVEIYVNVAEMGNMVFGAEEASLYYFNRSAEKLSIDQAALIAAALPNPRRYRVKNPSAFMINRKNWIIGQVAQLGGTSFLKNIE